MFHVVHPDRKPNQPIVNSFSTEELALRHIEATPGILVASEAALADAAIGLSMTQLVALYNDLIPENVKQIKKFETRAIGAKRVWDLVDYRRANPGEAFSPLPNEVLTEGERQTAMNAFVYAEGIDNIKAAREALAPLNLSEVELKRLGDVRTATSMYVHAQDDVTRQEAAKRLAKLNAAIPTQEEIDNIMGTTAKKAAAADKAAKKTEAAAKKTEPKAPRVNKAAAGKPAGKVADLRPIREGSMRAKVLAMVAEGKHTAAEIGKKLAMEASYVMAHCYCTARDNGIGYKVDDGKLVAIFPGSKTLADCIKSADAPKAPKKKAAKKDEPAAATA